MIFDRVRAAIVIDTDPRGGSIEPIATGATSLKEGCDKDD